ncbi:DNA helicase, UvrD/REP type, P-loop containing nucleoside triphosphate hydrolase, partial [Tanacetum coccineum]
MSRTSFYSVMKCVHGLTCVGSSSTQNSSVRIDDIDKMMSEDNPDQFMHLPNDAYPLIITFNRFLLMLDSTVGTSFFEKLPYVRQLVCGNQTSNSRLVWEEYMKFNVTYEIFRSSYWPHFNNKLTKNLDPSAIYTEIMSVIKGGFTEDNASGGILSRDDYVALCDGRISIFDSQKRELVYAIFLQYEKKKVQNGNFDLADLVSDLHRRLHVEGYKGDKMDYVFIDEVQDLSLQQIMLFKYVCPNVYEGFAFAGDTAQAIAKGIGFRFEDIRYLFFKKFLLASEKGQMSKMFQLSENFRTHAGVLNLAQSVMDVLYHFFPLFVDALSPETSRIGGELPVLLKTENQKNAIKVIFEMESDNSHKI